MANEDKLNAENEKVVDIFDTKNGDPLAEAMATPEDEQTNSESTDSQTETSTVPDKFKGKTLDEVISMYGNLESAYGRQGNEMGEIRKLADQILQNQLEPSAKENESDIDADTLLADPVKVINQVVTKHPALQELSGRVVTNERNAGLQALVDRHGNPEDYGRDQEFLAWISASPGRLERFRRANDEHDYATADDLLTTYKEIKEVRANNQEQTTTTQRKALATPAAGSASSAATPNERQARKPIYSRTQLMQLKVSDPARYTRMQPEIIAAYQEGRVR